MSASKMNQFYLAALFKFYSFLVCYHSAAARAG